MIFMTKEKWIELEKEIKELDSCIAVSVVYSGWIRGINVNLSELCDKETEYNHIMLLAKNISDRISFPEFNVSEEYIDGDCIKSIFFTIRENTNEIWEECVQKLSEMDSYIFDVSLTFSECERILSIIIDERSKISALKIVDMIEKFTEEVIATSSITSETRDNDQVTITRLRIVEKL